MQHSSSHTMASAADSKRLADRFDSQLPIELDGKQGLTRNISATGIYFESQADQAPGSMVQFVVEVEVQGQKLKMVCKGEVVRVDHKDSTVGIAVKLAHSFFADSQ